MVLIAAFLENLTSGRRLSAHTVLAYRTDLTQFETFLLETETIFTEKDITHHHIRDWILRLSEEKVAAKTVKRKIACLTTFFKFLQKNQHVTHNPMLKVSSPKVPKRLPSVVQEQQMERLFELVDFGSDFSGHRNRLILEMLYGTGIRRQELIQLKLPDLQTDRGLLKIIGKGNKQRLVPIPRYLQPMLESYLAVRKDTFPGLSNPHVFLTDQGVELYPKLVYNVVHKYLSMVSSTDQRSPHTLRHSFATHLSNSGADLNAIKTLLGHSSLAATQMYMHNGINRLKAVYDQAHPKSKNDAADED
jgi:integrase/recombinase XerC